MRKKKKGTDFLRFYDLKDNELFRLGVACHVYGLLVLTRSILVAKDKRQTWCRLQKIRVVNFVQGLLKL